MAQIGGSADHWIAARAATSLASIRLCAGVAIVAGAAVGLGRVRAGAIGRVAGASIVTLIGGGTSHRIAARAVACLTSITLRAGVAVTAGTAVGLGRVRAGAIGRVAGASI